ncbi:MAG: tripartite tricarboxylate transporter permease [Methanosarcinales archaeon]
MESNLWSIPLLILSILIGFILGIISGLIPGIHTNTFALILVAISPILQNFGFDILHIAIIILANSITHTFLDIIPSIFLGAPEGDTALTVLPGHSLLLDGLGIEAVRLSALGSAGSVFLSILLLIPLIFLFNNFYYILSSYIGWILVSIVVIMISLEKGEYIEGQGSLVPLKYKFYAIILFFLSGFLGILSFDRENLVNPIIYPFNKTDSGIVLMPLFSGLFGASMLITSLLTHSEIPPQILKEFELPINRTIRGIISGSLAGAIVAWLPGVTSTIASVLARLTISDSKTVHSNEMELEYNNKEIIVSISGANTANAIYSLIALYIINKTRSGAMASLKSIGVNLNASLVLLFIIIIVIVSILSYFATIYFGKISGEFLQKFNYSKLCLGVLIGLTAIVILFTGWFGFIIFLIAIPIGMIPSYAKIRRVHAMGVLLLPLILYY